MKSCSEIPRAVTLQEGSPAFTECHFYCFSLKLFRLEGFEGMHFHLLKYQVLDVNY